MDARFLIGCGLVGLLSSTVIAAPVYVTGVWDTDQVHILDESFASLSSFSVGSGTSNPNGITAYNQYIYSGHFNTREIIAYNFAGVEQFRWSDSRLNGLQGLTFIGNELAVASSGQIHLFNPFSGAFSRSFSSQGSSVEGIAFDGTSLWQLVDANIYETNVTDGSLLSTIVNAADSCNFDGTGIANVDANQLALGCTNGDVYVVSKATGVINNSFDNDLNMYGLSRFNVPEPVSLSLFGLGLFGLGLSHKKRKSIA
ncbi:PEP-CTERM sorting domain-containing protein [Photobacterium minamisatsumaniensis]|uniref:PEP-CTERM sorting domain-containing protein n=1 Tax=Photobacterium minamisatsumaniensis TaxID=2910233 RepID=UPI003D133C8C